jgi:hypothetical protein
MTPVICSGLRDLVIYGLAAIVFSVRPSAYPNLATRSRRCAALKSGCKLARAVAPARDNVGSRFCSPRALMIHRSGQHPL